MIFLKKQEYTPLEQNIINILEVILTLEIENIHELMRYNKKYYDIKIMFKDNNHMILIYKKDRAYFKYTNHTNNKQIILNDSFLEKSPRLLKIILKYLPRFYKRANNFLNIERCQEYEKTCAQLTENINEELSQLSKNT